MCRQYERGVPGIGPDNIRRKTVADLMGLRRDASPQMLAQAQACLKEMRRVGVEPNDILASVLVGIYAHAGRMDLAEALFREVRAAGVRPLPKTYRAMAGGCLQTGDTDRAAHYERIDMSTNAGKCLEFAQGHVMAEDVQKLTVAKLAKLRDADLAIECLENMQAVGAPLNDIVCAAAVRVCSNAGQAQRLEKMRSMFPLEAVGVCTYSALISHCGQHDMTGQGFAALDEMTRRSIEPDPAAQEDIMAFLTANAQPRRAVELHRQWSRCHPRVQHSEKYLTELLNACRSCGDAKTGSKAFDLLPATRRNAEHYAVMMDLCVLSGRPRKAIELFERMSTAGVGRSERCFTVAFEACSRFASGAVHARRIYRSMRKEAIEPTTGVFLALAHALLAGNEPEQLLRIHGEWEERHLLDDIRVHDSMITAHGLAGNPAAAERCFTDLRKAGMPRPTLATYTSLLQALQADLPRSLRWLQALEEAAAQGEIEWPDAMGYGAVALAYARGPEPEDAIPFLRGIAAKRPELADERLFDMTLRQFARQGDADLVKACVDLMLEHRVQPYASVLLDLVGAKHAAGRQDEAGRLLQWGVDRGEFRRDLGFDLKRNELDFHLGRLIPGNPEKDGEVMALTQDAAAAMFFHHWQARRIDPSTRFVVGDHGVGTVDEAVRAGMAQLRWKPRIVSEGVLGYGGPSGS